MKTGRKNKNARECTSNDDDDDLMSAPNCPKCGKPMALLDSETKRYYCYGDDVVYLGSERKWVGLADEAAQPGMASATPTKQKSVAVGLIANFLVTGAGLMYAGSWGFGILYLVVTIALAFFLWPLALLVALISYAHTVFAVQAYNSKATQRPPETSLPSPSTAPQLSTSNTAASSSPSPPSPVPQAPAFTQLHSVQARKSCKNCGASLPANTLFCRECGHAQRFQGESAEIRSQRVDARSRLVVTKTPSPLVCQYCGAKMPGTSRVCRVCGYLNR
jgi:ribosomal protein L40E/TM2 domain-containing membrane protein YozV